MDRAELSTLIIKNLMLEVLGDEEFCKKYTNGHSFSNTYGAHRDNLFMLTKIMAIEKGLIEKKCNIAQMAWGAPRKNLHEGSNTNFSINEIEKLWEVFYILLNNNVIGPGEYGSSPSLPHFHITQHGKVCIEQRDILPYDIDGYLKKLDEINDLNEWVRFYIYEALKCYNANCYNASTVMIGLSSEVLVEELINEFSKLLGKTRYAYEAKESLQCGGKTIKEFFDDKINKQTKISRKYEEFAKVFAGIKNLQEDLKNIMDVSARDSFFTYLRLNRNEVSHHTDVKKDESEVLLLFIGFTKYCHMMTEMINKMKQLNK